MWSNQKFEEIFKFLITSSDRKYKIVCSDDDPWGHRRVLPVILPATGERFGRASGQESAGGVGQGGPAEIVAILVADMISNIGLFNIEDWILINDHISILNMTEVGITLGNINVSIHQLIDWLYLFWGSHFRWWNLLYLEGQQLVLYTIVVLVLALSRKGSLLDLLPVVILTNCSFRCLSSMAIFTIRILYV